MKLPIEKIVLFMKNVFINKGITSINVPYKYNEQDVVFRVASSLEGFERHSFVFSYSKVENGEIFTLAVFDHERNKQRLDIIINDKLLEAQYNEAMKNVFELLEKCGYMNEPTDIRKVDRV